MKRNICLEDITDGKMYRSNDLAKLGCDDCKGCSACCRNMEALVLDPYDINQLKKGLTLNFQQLLECGLTIQPIDGLLLPIMQTSGDRQQCYFLDGDGRCKIHSIRPGICRLFPLGRYYHDDSFSYILQVNECQKERTGKIKIKKWLDIENLNKYEQYISVWHYFLKDIQEELPQLQEQHRRILHMYLLKNFFQMDFSNDFYGEFQNRIIQARTDLGLC